MLTQMTHRRSFRAGRVIGLVGLTLGLAGCQSLVDYQERDVVPPDPLANAAGAQALYAGAIRSFGAAFAGDAGGTEGQALTAGMMADEWLLGDTFNTRLDYDGRNTVLDNSTLLGVFRALQTARLDGHRAIDAITGTGVAESADARFGAMYNRIAMVFLMAGENYCSGIPFSAVSGGAIVAGSQLTTVQMLDSAAYYFDKALATNAGTNSINANFANMGKARILLHRGTSSFAAAAALVANIPNTFRVITEHSLANGGNENGIFVFNTQNERWILAHREGTNGLPFRGAGDGTNSAQGDPRVPWKRDAGDLAFDNAFLMYDLIIYTARDNSANVFKGEEARLIEAEAALQAGNTTLFLDKLNGLRAGVAGLAPLTDPGTAAGRVDLLFSERAFWTFSTATRLGDMRRLIRQYGRAANTVFPVGAYPRGGVYGNDVNFPVPDQEKQNPNYSEGITCIDRNA